MPSPDAIFGDKDWSDVRKEIARHVYWRFRWRGTSPDDLEDAIQAAILDLYDYWMELGGSLDPDKPDRNFKWAVWRGRRVAVGHLVNRFAELGHEVPYTEVHEELHEDESRRYTHTGVGADRTSPSPEEIVCERQEQEAARRFIERLPEAVTDAWLGDYLDGLTAKDSARKAGIGTNAMEQRRSRGMGALRDAAWRGGL